MSWVPIPVPSELSDDAAEMSELLIELSVMATFAAMCQINM